MNILVSLIYYLKAYLVVTAFASLHFLFNWIVLKQQAFDTSLGLKSLKANATKFEAFKSTKPFHPFYNLLVFPVVSAEMMLHLSYVPSLTQAVGFGILWVVYCVMFDLICWVLIPHPWRLTLHELFITYQPWISFAYVAIAVSPAISVFYLSYILS